MSGRAATKRADRKVAIIVAVTMAIAAFLTLPSRCGAAEFRVADNQVADYPTVQALFYMNRLLQERTGGKHSLRVFHSGQLGDEAATTEQTRAGVLDLNRVNVAPLAEWATELQLFSLPFLFRSTDHLRNVLDGPLGERLLASLEQRGLIGLVFFDSGARSFYNSLRPVRAPSDMEGLKLRIQASPLHESMIRALGAQPVVLEYSQVVVALQTRLVDGAENNWPSYVTREHYKIAPHITLTNHTMAPEVLFMSAATWKRLDPQEQALFRAISREAALYMRKQWLEWEQEAVRKAVSEGVKIVEDFDRSAFEKAVEPIRIAAARNERLRQLIEEVRAGAR